MSLAPGPRLGPDETVAPLGTGGRGGVYRARDTRLDRDVAVKVPPAQSVGDASVVVMIELHRRSQVLTVDRKDFGIYRRNDRQVIDVVAPPIR